MSSEGGRLLAALEAEITKVSKLEHELARVRIVLREQVTRLRVGVNPELVMVTLRQSLPHETTLALIERIDPVLSADADPSSRQPNAGLRS
jgi:hypothetical protein